MKRSSSLSWTPAVRRSVVLGVSGAAVAFALGAGCKKEKPVEYPQTPPQSYAGDAAPAPEAGAMPAPDAGAPAPDAAPAVDAGPQGLDMVTQQMLEAEIKKRAPKQARYMKKEGELFGGVVQQGGQVEQQFMIQPHKCYAVLAQGGPGVTEVDVQITAKPMAGLPLPSAVIAVDNTTGPAGAITPCWKNAFPVAFPATAVIKASGGAGAVAAQIYVK